MLPVSLPSVSTINTRSSTSLRSNSGIAAPMASPSTVRGPSIRIWASSSSSRATSRSSVNGACTNAAEPKKISPTRSPSRRSRKPSSTCFAAVSRSAVAPSGPVKSRVSMEPERSRATSRSRIGSSRTIGSLSHWGRASAATTASQTRINCSHCSRRRRITAGRVSASRPLARRNRSMKGTRTASRGSR